MGVLARGSVTDRPWGMTLGALGLRGLTGQLTLAGQYRVAFEQGAVVGAYSPLANDAAVRLALTGNLITSSQVSDIIRRIAAAPLRDEVEVLAEACRLQPDQAQRLRRRLVAQRAARTFAIDHGEFVVEDQINITVVPGSALDVRAVVFLGAKNNLTEERLVAELGQLGVWFKLKPEAVEDLPQYGFGDDDKPVLQLLLQGANLSDLETANTVLGARAVRAVTYALAVCGACEASATAGPALQRGTSQTGAPQPASPPRTRTTTTPPETTMRAAPTPTPAIEPKQHKTAPLGSRSPGSNPPTTRRGSATTPPASSSSGSSARIPVQDDSLPMGRVPTRDASLGSRAPTREAPNEPPRPGMTDPPTLRNPLRGGSVSEPANRPSDPAIGRAPSAPYGGMGPDPSVGRVPTPGDPATGRVPTEGPTGPRTITQSSGVPRETDSRNSSGATSAARTGSFNAVRPQDRSPSGGVRASDRSPSGGAERPSSSGIPRPGSRSGSQTNSPPVTPRTRTASSAPAMRPPADTAGRARTGSSGPVRSFTTQSPPLRAPAKIATRRPKQSTAATLEIEQLLTKKLPMLDQGVDYFTLFGLPVGAPADAVRSTYFMLARKLHPDRLAAIGIEDDDRQAQRLMACINEAFAILNDPVRRAEYLAILNRGGEAAVRAEDQKADEMAMRVMRAEEEFRQGEMALRREQIQLAITHFQMAVELQPNEAEYQALLAWAQFANAQDKNTVASQTRKALVRAAEKNSESPTAHFYLGRVERMLGREKEALYCFYQVLKIKPNHSEARSEARILEQRLKSRR